MATRKPKKPSLLDRTPVAEWTAAGLGGLLTLGVAGYLLVEGLSDPHAPPQLTVTREAAQTYDGGHVLPITVRNASRQTAAGVEVRATLSQAGSVVEERRARLAYVPGGGETDGGMVFQHDPADGALALTVEGYEEP